MKLTAEKSRLPAAQQWGLQALGVVLLIAYFFTVPTDLDGAPMIYLFRFFAFGIGLCLLLSVLAFRNRGQVNAFWQFNKIVIFRAILTSAFAFVLFTGLGLALAALDNLFGMDIPGRRYGQLWILINGIFSVGFILAGIPEDLDALDSVTEYPKGLKVFAQYVLSPLVLVYFVILYTYIAKIIITWNWPQGWVGRLILGFAATGILALFVLDPIKEQTGQSWIKRASRWYYIILIPLVVVLFLALWRRISEYGITEDRYLGLAIGVWMAVMAGYFLLSKSRSIKIIPASLCILAFAISFGPWGMFAVSERSQIDRLQGLLTTNSILVNGSVQKAPDAVSSDDVIEISAILWYLREVHGYDGIQGWFAENLRADEEENYRFKTAEDVADLMGIDFNRYPQVGEGGSYSFTVDLKTPVPVAGYDHLVQATYRKYYPDKASSDVDTLQEVVTTQDSIILNIISDAVVTDTLVMDLRPLIDSLTTAYGASRKREIPAEKAIAEFESDGVRAKIVLLSMYAQRTDETIELRNYDALILYSVVKGEE